MKFRPKLLSFLIASSLASFTFAEGDLFSGTLTAQEQNSEQAALKESTALDPAEEAKLEAARAAQTEEQNRLAAEKAEQARLASNIENVKAALAKEVNLSQLQLQNGVIQAYIDNEQAPLWDNAQAQKTFLKEYALFALSGVSEQAANTLNRVLKAEGKARDIFLTDAFLDYYYYNLGVAKNANQWLYEMNYKAKSPAPEKIKQWVNAVKEGKSATFVSQFVPKNKLYQETVAKLWAMQSGASAATSSATKAPAKTAAKASNAKTASKPAAESNNSALLYKLALNAQRLRIIPDFENGIYVNIPSYQLQYVRNGKTALESRVIVGKTTRQTPVLQSKLSNVVVNPPWTAPARLTREDLLPKIRNNPGYMNSMGYTLVDAKGKTVDPSSVNWSAYTSKNFPYYVRQKPGPNAALGLYKFNMPSTDAIYLHDTPNRSLFNESNRALSSGCVRVGKSDELATMLLKEAGWTDSQKQSVLKSQKTTSVTIKSDNPVYLYYVTTWVEQGKIKTLPDIYQFDKNQRKPALNWQALKL